jgi:Domain of unknown function (DUF4249)
MQRTIKILAPVLLVTLLWRCKEKYISPYLPTPTGYLVVEGYISGNSPTQFVLSRSVPLPGDSALPYENNAIGQVEGSDNSTYPLPGQGNGVYQDSVTFNRQLQYRLRIRTSGGEEYLSDFVPFRPTPEIDSISYGLVYNGLDVYANTHDPTNATRYYQWKYVETWEFHSAKISQFRYDSNTNTVVPRLPADQIFTCWHTGPSTNILLGSSAKLARDEIYQQPLRLLPYAGVELSILYTTLVSQYALTEDAYNYLGIMKKNSESFGSIFDAQPSQLNGNIHRLGNPAEQVIGYVSAGTVHQQRIFISSAQFPNWGYVARCPMPDDSIVPVDSFILRSDFYYGGLVPIIYHVDRSGGADGYIANVVSCVDCRAQGGVTVKPPFWPN